MTWSVPRLWEGRTVAILASGPSMTQAAADRLRGALPTIVVNDTVKLAPWADMLYAADTMWWRVNVCWANEFLGLKVTSSHDCDVEGVVSLAPSGPRGFDPDPRNVRTGGNSGYQALHVAIQAGAARVLLLGYDMHGSHWFGMHQPPLRNTRPETMGMRAKCFADLKGLAEIVNCTPGSAITAFPIMTLDEAWDRFGLGR